MRTINILLGFFISWPLYIDLHTYKFIIHLSNEKVYYGSTEGLPLPFGIFSFVCLFLLINKKYYFKPLIKNLPVFAILVIILIDTGLFAYVFGVIFILLNLLYKEKNRILRDFRGLTSGWLIGGSFQIILFITYNYDYIFGIREDSPNIFNIQIYSFFVSYSAVMSLFFSCILVRILKSGLPKFVLLSGPFSFFPVFVAMRKAALLDLLSGIMFSISSIIFGGGKVSLRIVYALLTLSIIFFVFYEQMDTVRDVSVSGSWYQRSVPYINFAFILFELNTLEFLFGYETGFGGNSNILLDVFTRAGLLGVVALIASVVLPFIKIFRAAWGRAEILDRLLIVMLINNLVIGNLVNLNLTQPYFVINFLVATLLVLESDKEKRSANSHL